MIVGHNKGTELPTLRERLLRTFPKSKWPQYLATGRGPALVNPDGPEAAAMLQTAAEALEGLLARWDAFKNSDSSNQADAYYTLVKGAYDDWDNARATLERLNQ